MKKMYHKKYAIVIIAVLAIIMSACSKSAEYNQDKNADWDEQEYNVKTLNEIIRCLDEKDEQALINIMSNILPESVFTPFISAPITFLVYFPCLTSLDIIPWSLNSP